MSKKNYHLLDPTDIKSIQHLLNDLETSEYVAFDIETNSSIERIAQVIGIGISFYDNEGWYIPFREWNKQEQKLIDLVDADLELDIIHNLCEILKEKKLIMHNGVYDITVMWHRYEIDLTEALYADTILMKHTIDEERPFGLKDLAIKYQRELGIPYNEIANQEQLDLKESVIANGGKWNKDEKEIYKGDLKLIAKYCAADCDLTFKLFYYLQGRLEEEGLEDFFYNQEVMPLCRKATIPMKRGGVYTNVTYFKELEKELESGIIKLTGEIFKLIGKDIEPFVKGIVDAKVQETRTGKYALGLLQHYKIPIPSNKKTGKPTLAKKELQSLASTYPDNPALKWLLYSPKYEGDNGPEVPKEVRYAVKKSIFLEAHPDHPRIFNLASNDHIAWLLFQRYKEEPKDFSRKTGKPKVDKKSIVFYEHLPFVSKLLKLKRHQKFLNTYVRPIISLNIDGWIYPPMKQFGTTSGRYACGSDSDSENKEGKDINLQTLPRFEKIKACPKCESKKAIIKQRGHIYFDVKCPECKFDEEIFNDSIIKRGFIAPPGYKVVNADFSSLEPRIFSWVSGDMGLKMVWQEGLDLYSQIAIDVFNIEGVSAKESDPNYLKKVYPDKRQLAKTFALAVPYGANEWRIAGIMKCDPEEAKHIIDKYLDAYPDLQKYMLNQEIQARTEGYVCTKFGRIRHLPEAKILYAQYYNDLNRKKKMQSRLGEEEGSLVYYNYRNLLNNAKNFPIQATAAHVCNAALIKLSDLFVEHKIDGHIALQVHDEITCIIREKHSEKAAKLLKEAMEHNHITEQIDIPIIAEPIISDNFAEAK